MAWAQSGIFPASFVTTEDPPGGSAWARATYEFEGEAADELTLYPNDIVFLIGKVGTDWYEGVAYGHQGIFPKAFVEVVIDVKPPPAVVAPKRPRPVRPQHPREAAPRAVALYDYDAVQDDEISFGAGDILGAFTRLF